MTTISPIRIMLVDNDPFVRPGLRMIVETMPRFKVVAEANSAEEALQQLERNLGVDLALIDIRMRGMNGIKLTERISKNFPAVSVLIFTNEDREEYLREAKEAGAKSYLLKERPWPEIASTIENIIDKGVDFPEPSSLAPPEPPLILEEHLTPRELQVLWHVGDGKSSKEIARLLKNKRDPQKEISYRVVERHRFNIGQKLKLKHLKRNNQGQQILIIIAKEYKDRHPSPPLG